MLNKVIKEISDNFYPEIYGGYIRYLNSLLLRYVSAVEETGETSPYDMRKPVAGRFDSRFNGSERAILGTFIDRERDESGYAHYNAPYHVRVNVAEIIEKRAAQETKDVLASFEHKLNDKLSGLVTESTTVVVASGNLDHNTIKIENGNNSFMVLSQVVTVFPYSSNRDVFTRYPTTFHDVVINGERVAKKVSIAKLKELLA